MIKSQTNSSSHACGCRKPCRCSAPVRCLCHDHNALLALALADFSRMVRRGRPY